MLFVLICAACTTDTTVDVVVSDEKLYASMAEVEGRVALNSLKQTVWNEGDIIWMMGNNELSKWRFDGKTGDRSGTFTKIENYVPTDLVFDQYYAFYNLEAYGTVGNSNAIVARIPDVQSYVEDSYAVGANVMMGKSFVKDNFSFVNILGYLCLSITGDKSVKSITVFGNNNENLSGRFILMLQNVTDLNWYNEMAKSITIDCGDGVALSKIPTRFYLTTMPAELSAGITVNITFTDGTTFQQSTTKSITISRNTIQPMATFSASLEDLEWQYLYIYHRGSSISTPQFTGGGSIGTISWGDGYLSNIGGSDKYTFVDDKTEHIVSVEVAKSDTVSIEDCSGIYKIDLSQF